MSEASSNELALERTKLANQRTYLAYVRTGFVIAGIAGIFKKKWIAAFGLMMVLGSTIQYYLIDANLDKGRVLHSKIYDIMPIFYVFLSIGALYLQMNK